VSERAPLTPEQNERARSWLLELLAQHKDSQGDVAKLLGVSPPTVSRLRSGTLGTSVRVIQRMAKLLGRDVGEVLDPASAPALRVIAPDARYPSSFAAQRAALVMGCAPEDIRAAIRSHGVDDDPGDSYWIAEFVRERDRRRRRELTPSASPTLPAVAKSTTRRIRP